MASDDDFFVLRRFDSLSTRVALYQQDQVALLEQELGIQDRRCREALGDARNRVDDGGTFRSDLWKRRGQILEDLAGVLSRYRIPLLSQLPSFSNPHREVCSRSFKAEGPT